MEVRIPSQKALASLVVVLLSLMTALGTVSGPPLVEISDLPGLDGGAVVRVRGIVVDIWGSDAGSLSLVLADLQIRSTVKVVCSQSSFRASAEVRTGDEIAATGQLEITGGRPLIWSSLDDIDLLVRSREALHVEDLASSWDLFIDDRLEVAGILVESQAGGSLRLVDPDGFVSIALLTRQTDCYRYIDRMVLVDAVLDLQPQTMELVLDAFEISVGA
jgi:hypothetical protein